MFPNEEHGFLKKGNEIGGHTAALQTAARVEVSAYSVPISEHFRQSYVRVARSQNNHL